MGSYVTFGITIQYVAFEILSHSVLCRIRGYVVWYYVVRYYVVWYYVIRHYVAFWVMSFSIMCIRHYVAFGIMSFGIVLFSVMLFGLLLVYLVHSVIKTILSKTFGDQKLFSVTHSDTTTILSNTFRYQNYSQ